MVSIVTMKQDDKINLLNSLDGTSIISNYQPFHLIDKVDIENRKLIIDIKYIPEINIAATGFIVPAKYRNHSETNNKVEFTLLQDPFGHSAVVSEPEDDSKPIMHAIGIVCYHESTIPSNNLLGLSLSDDSGDCFFNFQKAYYHLRNNLSFLCYCHSNNEHCFSLENLVYSSQSDAKSSLSLLSSFKKVLNFKQQQHGGRRKGERTRATILKYNKICNYRFSQAYIYKSDNEFLQKYTEYNQNVLNRAKKWYKEGKPGL